MAVGFMLNAIPPYFSDGFLATVKIICVGEYFGIIKS